MKSLLNISCLRISLCILFCLAGTSFIYTLYAQIPDRVFKTDSRIDPEKKGELSVEFDNLSFFKDDEYTGSFMKGYTLPGLWLQAKAVYYPLEMLKLEAGVHLQRFWGANRYPNMAYQDIAHWKGDQYQRGFHALPWFRAQVALSDHVNIVLGDLYGAANHNLIGAIAQPELNYGRRSGRDGIALLHNSHGSIWDAVWVNWEKAIFERYPSGGFCRLVCSPVSVFNDPIRVTLASPLQVLAQHRGGEIDTILTNSVQTLMNGAVGIGGVWNTGHKIFKSVNVELDVAGYYQQAGKLWPFDNGYGVYARASADIYDFRVKTSYWRCHQFISMFGSPFYGAVSTSDEGLTFDDPSCVYFGLEYSRELAKGFSLGIDLDIYEHLPVVFRGTEQNGYKSFAKTSFSAGIYLRVTPSFLIKKF